MTDINSLLFQDTLVIATLILIGFLIRLLLSVRQVPKPYPGTDAIPKQDYSKWNPKEEVKKFLEKKDE